MVGVMQIQLLPFQLSWMVQQVSRSHQTWCCLFRPKDLLPSRDVSCSPALSLALIAVALGSSGLRYQCELTTLVGTPCFHPGT